MSRLLKKLLPCSKPTPSTQTVDVECAVCQDTPTKPCTLPCGNKHIFCFACLQGLVAHNHSRSHFPCPLCRKRVRIPLGGVAVFKNNKGARSKILSKLPAIRPRCRTWSSDSSGSHSITFELPSFNVDSSDDSNADPEDLASIVASHYFETTSEGSVSFRAPNLDWLNQLNSLRSDGIGTAAALLEDLPVSFLSEGQMLAQSRREYTMTENGEIVLRQRGDMADPAVRRHGSEELDMAVVMQLIADMEQLDRQDGPEDTQGTEAGVCPAQESSGEGCYPMSEEPSTDLPLREQPDFSDEEEDWKHRAVAGTLIPRPTLVSSEHHEDNRRSEIRQENQTLAEEIFLPDSEQHLSAMSAANSEHADLADQPSRAEPSRINETQLTQAETDCTEKQLPLKSPVLDTNRDHRLQCPLVNSNGSKPDELVPPTTQDCKNSLSAGTASSEECCKDPRIHASEVQRKHAYGHVEQQSKDVYSAASQDILSPEEWRLQELHKIQMAEMRMRKTQTVEASEDWDPDVAAVVAEDPEAWSKRISSLHNRRRRHSSRRQSERADLDTKPVEGQVKLDPTVVSAPGPPQGDIGRDGSRRAGLGGHRKDPADKRDTKASNVTIITV